MSIRMHNRNESYLVTSAGEGPDSSWHGRLPAYRWPSNGYEYITNPNLIYRHDIELPRNSKQLQLVGNKVTVPKEIRVL